MTSTSTLEGLTALVFGGSGLTGHALLKVLVEYPSPTTFTRVIGLTNRPLSPDIAQLPRDERLELYSGCDLLDYESSLMQLQHIAEIHNVTHVYYAAYAGHGSNYTELKRVNIRMLKTAVGAVEICCPDLRFITLNTGGKTYGVEFIPDVPYHPPLLETSPRIPEPYASHVFYYAQYDILSTASEGKSWQFCEIRPDGIVGFVPQNNAMNIAQGLGLFFSLYREMHGNGAEVQFPYGAKAWEALHTDSSSDILGRFHVFASLRPESVSGRAFNVCDGPAFTWRELWPKLAVYFGLKGTGPAAGGKEVIGLWVDKHKSRWEEYVARRGLKARVLEATNYGFVDDVMGITFRRDLDSRARMEVGFTEQRDVFEGYRRAFDEMKKARIIP
ncbi:hypothetical protein LTR49_027275 [Elasticomyces elasticus]|nr:hypothetical protein LTR49_027275 [Elasticomyces elasticus]